MFSHPQHSGPPRHLLAEAQVGVQSWEQGRKPRLRDSSFASWSPWLPRDCQVLVKCLSSVPQPPTPLHRSSLRFWNLVWSRAPSQDGWGERRCRYPNRTDDSGESSLLPSSLSFLCWGLWTVPHPWDSEGEWIPRGCERPGVAPGKPSWHVEVPRKRRESCRRCSRALLGEEPGPCWAQVWSTCLRAVRTPSAGFSRSNNLAPICLSHLPFWWQEKTGVPPPHPRPKKQVFVYLCIMCFVVVFNLCQRPLMSLTTTFTNPTFTTVGRTLFSREKGISSDTLK